MSPISAFERSALNPTPQLLDSGSRVAAANCISCHGTDGVSSAPGLPHLAGQRAVYLYRTLQEFRQHGRANDAMSNTAGFLSDPALMSVAAYYAALAPTRPDPQNASEDGADLPPADAFADIRQAMKSCVRCHGADGNASASGMPNLSAQHPVYFIASMKAYADGRRNHRIMAKLAAELDDETLQRMGIYYGIQEPAATNTTGDGDAAAGEALTEPCAACHGKDGNASRASMPTLAGQDARYFLKAMQTYVSGSRQHQAMIEAAKSLNEEQLADMAAFYALQPPIHRNVRAPLTPDQWIQRCERCHGVDGNSTDPRLPMLAGQDHGYLAKTLAAFADGSRSSSTMHAMSSQLDPADIDRLAGHYASREPKSVIYIDLPCDETAGNEP